MPLASPAWAVLPASAAATGIVKALIRAVFRGGVARALPPLAATRSSKASTTGCTAFSWPLVSMSATVASRPSGRSITARQISPPAICSTSSNVISSVPRNGSADALPCWRRPSKNVLISGSYTSPPSDDRSNRFRSACGSATLTQTRVDSGSSFSLGEKDAASQRTGASVPATMATITVERANAVTAHAPSCPARPLNHCMHPGMTASLMNRTFVPTGLCRRPSVRRRLSPAWCRTKTSISPRRLKLILRKPAVPKTCCH